MTFLNFPKVVRKFPEILKNSSNTVLKLYERFENFRRLPKISEKDPKMFRV